MSRQKWSSGKRSEGCCGPSVPGAGGLRWVLFAVLVYVGVRGASWLAPRLGELFWLAWLLFGLWWIPLSLDLSRRLLQLPPIVRVEAPKSRDRRRAPALTGRRCPHCGERVEGDQAICPRCYRDLKSNCERCGRIIDAEAEKALCEECQRAEQLA